MKKFLLITIIMSMGCEMQPPPVDNDASPDSSVIQDIFCQCALGFTCMPNGSCVWNLAEAGVSHDAQTDVHHQRDAAQLDVSLCNGIECSDLQQCVNGTCECRQTSSDASLEAGTELFSCINYETNFSYCANFAFDPMNCGGCEFRCDPMTQYCYNAHCMFW